MINFSQKWKPLKQIVCGPFHNIILLENGSTYVWGRNDFGQVGIGNKEDVLIPTLNPLKEIEKILTLDLITRLLKQKMESSLLRDIMNSDN